MFEHVDRAYSEEMNVPLMDLFLHVKELLQSEYIGKPKIFSKYLEMYLLLMHPNRVESNVKYRERREILMKQQRQRLLR